MILIQHDGKTYQASDEAYGKDRILLEDGTLLVVGEGWIESMPPVPQGLIAFVQVSAHLPIETLAGLLDAVVAISVNEEVVDVSQQDAVLTPEPGGIQQQGSTPIYVVDEWYETLPLWRQFLFNTLCLLIGDLNAIALCGFYRAQRPAMTQPLDKAQEKELADE